MLKTSSPIDRIALPTLLLAFFVLSVWYGLWNPSGEGVDEAEHLAYVQNVKEQRRLPVMPTNGAAAEVWMGHHPPLFYAVGALVVSPIDMGAARDVLRPNPHFVWSENDGRNGWNAMLHYGQDAFPWRGAILALHVVRLMSSLLGAVAVVAIYLITRRLLPRHDWAPVGATALTALNPSFLYMTSTVHHDALLAALYALGILWAIDATTGVARVPAWAAGLLAGGAALTKISGLTLLPLLGLAVTLSGMRRHDLRRTLAMMLQLLAGWAIVCGWWFIRNQVLYGDPLGWGMYMSVYRHVVRTTPYTWGLFRHDFVAQVGRTFWGGFGFMHITFPAITRWLWLVSGVGVLGWAFLVARRFARPGWRRYWPIWTVALTAPALLLASFVRFSVTTQGAGHGRYLYPAVGPVAALVIAGLGALGSGPYRRALSLGLAAAMAVFAVWLPARHVIPKYRGPTLAAEGALQGAAPSLWVFGDAVSLVAYRVEPDIAIPGTTLTVSLYWRAVNGTPRGPDAHAKLYLLDDQGNELDAESFWPSAVSIPSVWRPEDTVLSRALLHVPHDIPSGRLSLGLELTDGRDGPLLEAKDHAEGAGHEMARFVTLVTPGTVPEVLSADVPNKRLAMMGDAIVLVGYRLPGAALRPGDTLIVELFWRAERPPAEDYVVFVHCLDASGNLVAQYDRQPGGGSAPTTSWSPGKTLRDSYPVVLPDTLAPGEYDVRVGMYTWPAILRLETSADGHPSGDSVLLGTVRVAD